MNPYPKRIEVLLKLRMRFEHYAVPIPIVAAATHHYVPTGNAPTVINVWSELEMAFAKEALAGEFRFRRVRFAR